MKRRLTFYLPIFISILALSSMQSVQDAHAQETVREVFAAGGSSNNLLVYNSTDEVFYVNDVRDIVTSTMDQYDSLFDNPAVIADLEVMVILGIFSPSESEASGTHNDAQSQYDIAGASATRDLQGEHIFLNPEICYLQVDAPSADVGALTFEIAYEIARCYLASSFDDLNTDYGSTDDWLVTSMSEWLASVITEDVFELSDRAGYNQLADLVSTSDVIIGNGGFLSNSHYAGVYFWQYLSTLTGDAVTLEATASDVLNLLFNYTGFSYSPESFHPYLSSEIENLPDQFSQFGVALATDSLVAQPDSDLLSDAPIPTDLPRTETISMGQDFSLQFLRYSTFIDVPAIQVSVTALNASTQIQVTGNNFDYQSVTLDAPVVLCKPDDEIIISTVISRAYEADTFATDALEITYSPLEEFDDCEEDPVTSDDDEEDEDTSCLVGEFELVDIPREDFSSVFGELAGEDDIIIGSMLLTIDESLNINHSADDFVVNTETDGLSMVVTIDIAVSGNFTVSTDDGITYTVQQLNYSFDSISAQAVVDGLTLDLSDLAADMVDEFGNSVFLPPASLVCTAIGLDYYVSINGVESVWGYWRIIPEAETESP